MSAFAGLRFGGTSDVKAPAAPAAAKGQLAKQQHDVVQRGAAQRRPHVRGAAPRASWLWFRFRSQLRQSRNPSLSELLFIAENAAAALDSMNGADGPLRKIHSAARNRARDEKSGDGSPAGRLDYPGKRRRDGGGYRLRTEPAILFIAS